MRTTVHDLAEAGVLGLAAVLDHELGPGSVSMPTEPDAGFDLVLDGPAGPMTIEVKAVAVLDAGRADRLIADYGRHSRGVDHVPVVVADLIPESVQRALREAGWSYLDRRGRLWFRGPGVVLRDNELAPLPRFGDRDGGDPITGAVGLGVAATLLMHPGERLGPRELARRLGCSPSAAHAALTRLRDHALVGGDGHALLPDLFLVTADAWKPERQYVMNEPTGKALTVATAARYVVSGDQAAVALGAPLVASAKSRPLVYLPSAGEVRRVARTLGIGDPATAAAVLSVAPFPAVTEESVEVRIGRPAKVHWRVAHPVIVALDLAQDRSRGREILADWTPEDVARVW